MGTVGSLAAPGAGFVEGRIAGPEGAEEVVSGAGEFEGGGNGSVPSRSSESSMVGVWRNCNSPVDCAYQQLVVCQRTRKET